MYSTVLIQEDWNIQPFSVVKAKAALSPQLFLLRPWVLIWSGAQTLNPLQGSPVLSNLSQQATSYGSLNILCYVTIIFQFENSGNFGDWLTLFSQGLHHILFDCPAHLKSEQLHLNIETHFKLNQTTSVSLSPCAKGFVHHYHKVFDQHHIW